MDDKIKQDTDTKIVEKDDKKSDDGNIEETGGRGGLEPTRYGDWEIAGKCVDF